MLAALDRWLRSVALRVVRGPQRPAEALRKADALMYAAKRQGKGVTVFDEAR